MKKKTKKILINSILIILVAAMTFGGLGSAFYAFFIYPKLLEQAQIDYQAQLEEYIKQIQLEEASASATLSAQLEATQSSFAGSTTNQTENQNSSSTESLSLEENSPSFHDFDLRDLQQ